MFDARVHRQVMSENEAIPPDACWPADVGVDAAVGVGDEDARAAAQPEGAAVGGIVPARAKAFDHASTLYSHR